MVHPRTIILATLLHAAATVALAQQPGIELQIAAQILELGEAINVQLVCTNTAQPETPEAIVPDGLKLELVNPTPASNSMTQIFNGRRSSQTTYTYQLRLTTLKEGIFTLGPITVKAGGTTYQTAPIDITVRNTEVASVPEGDRYIYASIRVEPTELYVTENYEATLTFGIRKVQIDGQAYNLDMLQQVLDVRSSQLSVFANGRARTSERWLRDSNGQRHHYDVFHVTVQVRAEDAGEFTVGPVFLKANYPTAIGPGRGFFRRNQITRTRRETVRTDAVTVTVKAPPDEGRPVDYTGALGRYTMGVTAKPTRVEQGQPVTLAIAIRGAPLEGVLGPDLNLQPELASRFDYTRDELVGDIESGSRVFRRAVFPKQIGEQVVPPISWSYFDPSQEKYITLTSRPIDIVVDPPTETTSGITMLDEPQLGPQHSALTVLTDGLSANFIDAATVLADHSFALTPPWIASLVASPLAWLGVMLGTRHRARLQADPRYARRRRARRVALGRIKRALRNAEPRQALLDLAEALAGYVADRFGLGTGTVTAADVRAALSGDGLDDALTTEIVGFLEACDATHYAPGASAPTSPAKAAAQVRRWIDRLEKTQP